MNCDRIAPFYHLFEKVAFGGRLQRHRTTFLGAAEGKRRALVLGDGNGRFTEILAKTYPELRIDCVEISAGMLAEARKRFTSEKQVNLIHGDALTIRLPEAQYNIVFTHFFLDCFNAEHVAELTRRISPALAIRAVWVVSDFREARDGWRKIYTHAWLAVMYRFFRFATGLENKQLPRYDLALAAAGFSRCEERVSMSGLIASELWER